MEKEIDEKEYIEFFELVLDKKNLKLEKEIDLVLARELENPYIYYTKEIEEFFNTKPMKRLGQINQLGTSILTNPNAYHTRLEHCKGAYKNALDFWVYKCRDEEYKEEISQNQKQKQYILVDIMDMARHDDGHCMMSHCLESLICNGNKDHDELATRILLESAEYKESLDKIKPGLHDAMKSKALEDTTAFKFLREGNIDFDRLDYLMRDNMQLGKVYNREMIDDILENCTIKTLQINGQEQTIPVYGEHVLSDIETFLELRKNGYIYEYNSERRKTLDYLAKELCLEIVRNENIDAPIIKNAANNYNKETIEDIDIDKHLENNDIKFFGELIDIYLNGEDENINSIITKVLPDLTGLLQITMNLIDTKIKGKNMELYEDYELYMIEKLKELRLDTNKEKLEKINTDKMENISSAKYADKEAFEYAKSRIEKILRDNKIKSTRGIIFGDKKIRVYKSEEPIYVECSDGKIYTIDKHPQLSINLDNIDNYIIGVLPDLLRMDEIEEDVISEIEDLVKNDNEISKKNNISKSQEKIKNKVKDESVNMSMWKVGVKPYIIGLEER